MRRPDIFTLIGTAALAVTGCAALVHFTTPVHTVAQTAPVITLVDADSDQESPAMTVEPSAPPPSHTYDTATQPTQATTGERRELTITAPTTQYRAPSTTVTPYAIAAAKLTTVPEVVIVGDSLTVGSEQKIRTLVDAAGVPLRIDARSGRPTREGLDVLRGISPQPGAVVVLALGTNDSNDYTTYSAYIDEAMDIATGASRVVWLTVNRPKGLEEINRALFAARDRYPNLRIADWLKVQEVHPEYLVDDGVHFTSKGNTARAAFVFNAALA